jgi:Uma2 family endonuclease
MSTLSSHVSGPLDPDSLPSPLHRLSLEQYEAMVASGVFGKADRFHLIHGLLVTKMSENDPHCTADDLCGAALTRVLPPGWYIRAAKPIRLPTQASKPEPDRCVVRGSIRDYSHRSPEPGDAALVVEVSDSSLREDRKMTRVYGASGIPTYWIVNLVDRQVEVYTTAYADGYHSRQDYIPGQEIPVLIEGVEVGRIRVDDILPERLP